MASGSVTVDASPMADDTPRYCTLHPDNERHIPKMYATSGSMAYIFGRGKKWVETQLVVAGVPSCTGGTTGVAIRRGDAIPISFLSAPSKTQS